jgi:hypothetical protein
MVWIWDILQKQNKIVIRRYAPGKKCSWTGLPDSAHNIECRVARFFLEKHTKTGKNNTKLPQKYQMATKYSRWL